MEKIYYKHTIIFKNWYKTGDWLAFYHKGFSLELNVDKRFPDIEAGSLVFIIKETGIGGFLIMHKDMVGEVYVGLTPFRIMTEDGEEE